ncbi:hypothetical protein [Streptomyces sp. DSM 15324]|nr:hypothetical protein [Streptomyces sp. DSM 15324]
MKSISEAQPFAGCASAPVEVHRYAGEEHTCSLFGAAVGWTEQP